MPAERFASKATKHFVGPSERKARLLSQPKLAQNIFELNHRPPEMANSGDAALQKLLRIGGFGRVPRCHSAALETTIHV